MAQHVVPRDGGWAVRRGGSGRVTRRYGTLLEAIDAELKLARKQKTELDLMERMVLFESGGRLPKIDLLRQGNDSW